MMKSLWTPYDIPIVCIAGEPGSGKTMWGLTVDPDCLTMDHEPTTIVWDGEKSSAPYVGALNFKRIDVPLMLFSEGLAKQPDAAYHLFRKQIESLEPHKYRVGVIDTVQELEEGIAAYVRANPGKYGYTSNQWDKLEGVFWGVVKSEYKKLLMYASQKFETLVLTTHMRDEFKSGKPTHKRQPKGKDTIIQVASIYMTISRNVKPGSTTAPVKPSGICAWPRGKVRLLRLNPETNSLEPILPPFLEDASPSGIRRYFLHPPNYSSLNPVECSIPTDDLTLDDRLRLQAEIAASESVRAQAELSKAEVEKEIAIEVLKEKVSPVDLKTRLLSLMSVSEAKQLLKSKYGVELFVQLTVTQLNDLKEHLDSLGN